MGNYKANTAAAKATSVFSLVSQAPKPLLYGRVTKLLFCQSQSKQMPSFWELASPVGEVGETPGLKSDIVTNRFQRGEVSDSPAEDAPWLLLPIQTFAAPVPSPPLSSPLVSPALLLLTSFLTGTTFLSLPSIAGKDPTWIKSKNSRQRKALKTQLALAARTW